MWKKLVKDIWAWKINVWSVSGMHTSFSSCSIPYYRRHYAQIIYDSRSSDDTATHIQESQRSTSKWKHDIRDNVKKSWREYLFNQLSYEEDRRLATKRTTDRASLRNFVAIRWLRRSQFLVHFKKVRCNFYTSAAWILLVIGLKESLKVPVWWNVIICVVSGWEVPVPENTRESMFLDPNARNLTTFLSAEHKCRNLLQNTFFSDTCTF